MFAIGGRMTVSLTDDRVRQIHFRAQRLVRQSPETRSSVVRLVKELCGIQAQDARAATLAVRVRSSGLIAADVRDARIQDSTVVRMWGLRGTLHLLAVEDLDWLLPLLGPPFIAGIGDGVRNWAWMRTPVHEVLASSAAYLRPMAL